jgi:NADH:ubiquinone oxidoreductase subunit 6 (subunit J)
VPENSIAILGNTLVDAQGLVLPFEVASVLLLVALIGAATIARER